MDSVDLASSTIQAWQDLKDKLIPYPTPIPSPFPGALPDKNNNNDGSAPPPVDTAIGTKGRWGDNMRSLLRLCNATAAADLPPIWVMIAPLSRDMAISTMDAAYHKNYKHFCVGSPRIYHSIAALVLGLAVYPEDPDGVGDAINIFLFSQQTPSAGSEAALLSRR